MGVNSDGWRAYNADLRIILKANSCTGNWVRKRSYSVNYHLSPSSFFWKTLLWTIELKKERQILNKRACQKLSILKPSTKCAPIIIMKAFITKRKRPSVNIVAGNVSRINKGFTTASSIASTKANSKAVKISAITIPGRIYASINTFTVVINILIKNFMVHYFDQIKLLLIRKILLL